MKKTRIIRYILLIIFAILMTLSAKNIIIWFRENKTNEKIIKQEKQRLINIKGQKKLDIKIKKDNNDTIGWLIVEGTKINYPVVQYKNNEFYLTHDFEKKKNSAGWIFMDYQNTLSDQNIVIYGHHRKDESMFGSIDNIYKSKNKNLTIFLITTNETIEYSIFSIYKTSSEDNYNNRNFNNFNQTKDKFAKKSEINFNKNHSNSSQIITLSTCHSNNIDRIVVHAYKKN